MDYKVIYSPNAISDLAEVVGFVAQDDPQAALRLGKQLADDADSLARHPYRFPKFRRRANVRKLVTGQYLILYRIVQTAKVVEILRFGTGRRKPAFVRAKNNDSRRRGVAQNASKSDIGQPNRCRSSRIGFAIETGLEHGGYVPRGRKAEDGRIDDLYNLFERSTSSYPARTRRNIEESDGTVIFSLN